MMDGGLTAREPFILRDRRQGAIVFVENSGRFFVHLADEAPLLAGLIAKMEEKLSPQRAAGGPFSVLVAGTIVAALYADGKWYRAQVVAADTAERAATLFYLDFGNVEVQPFDCVRALPREFRAWPPFAVACSLSGSRRQTDDAALFRKMLVDDTGGAPLIFVVIETGAVAEVEIYDGNRDNLGKRFSKEAERSRLLSCVGRPLSHAAAAFYPAAPSFPVPTALPPLRARKPFTSLAAAADQSSLRFAAIAAETLTERRHNVVVSFVASPSDVWLRLSDADADERLRLLEQRLQEAFGLSTPPAAPVRWQSRQPCAALFAVDGRWHRAALLDTPSVGCPVKVVFVDYGNEESVRADELRPLPADFITVSPALAIRCQIAGVEPPDGSEWSTAATDFLESKLETVSFSATFLKRGDSERFQVELIETASAQSLSQQLISRQLAADASPPPPQTSSTVSAIARTMPVAIPLRAAEPPPRAHTVTFAPEPAKFSFAPLKFTIGQQLGTVAFILGDGPLIMWLQASIYEEELAVVDEACQRLAKGQPHEAIERPLAPGDVCLAYFAEDGDWYRAQVLADGGAEGVAVRFVDFGNESVCNAFELRRVPDDAAVRATPQLAFRCKLAGDVEAVGTWTDDDNEAFQSLVNDASGCVVGVAEGDALVVVELKRDNGISVAQLLLDRGLVKAEGNPTVGSCVVDAVVEASSSQLTVKGLPPLTVPARLGDYLDVTVFNVHSAGRVFVHLRTNSSVLPELHNMIGAHFDGPFSNYVLVNPRPRDLCAFKYAAGNKFGVSWCRAMIKGRSSPKIVQLYLVDTGDNVESAVDEVYELGAELFAVPPQAIRLSLPGVTASLDAARLAALIESKSAVVQLQKLLPNGDGFSAAIALDDCDESVNELLDKDQQPKGNRTRMSNGLSLRTDGDGSGDAVRPAAPMKVTIVRQKPRPFHNALRM